MGTRYFKKTAIYEIKYNSIANNKLSYKINNRYEIGENRCKID